MEQVNSEISDLRLTMEVSSGSRCFDLNDVEKLMGPDDWAWRFLRLNKKYQIAYYKAIDKRLTEAAQDNRSERTIVIERPSDLHRMFLTDDSICRKNFGLSTWLDPEMESLPTLADGESWFSPLATVIAEPRFDALKTDIFGYRVLHKYLQPESDTNDDASLDEQVCSSGHRRRAPWMYGSVWFAIDCSVPPDGQINSISAIADMFATEMAKGKLTANAFVPEAFKIKLVDPKGWASMLPSPTEVEDCETDAMEMWRLVKVCLVGPVQTQLDKCRAELLRVHKALVKDKPWREYFQERYRPNLSGNDEGVGMDGSTLKAYLMMAEFNSAKITDSKSIIRELAKMGAGKDLPPRDLKRPSNPWLDDVEKRAILFDKHAKRGQEYVNGGYKWLVHSQNPPRLKSGTYL